MESLDLSRTFCTVRFDGVHAGADDAVGQADEVSSLVERQLAIACVLTAAESVGAMERDFDVALQYAKDRIAFGRPIGSFQAIKHVLADTSLALEMSKAITLAAAETLGSGDDHGVQIAAMAKAFVNDSGQRARPELLPDLRRHRVHLGARPAPVPAAPGDRRRALRSARLATRAALPARRSVDEGTTHERHETIDLEGFRQEAR